MPPAGSLSLEACASRVSFSTDGTMVALIVKRSPALAIYLRKSRRVKRIMRSTPSRTDLQVSVCPGPCQRLTRQKLPGDRTGTAYWHERPAPLRIIMPSQSVYNTLIPKGRVNGHKKFLPKFSALPYHRIWGASRYPQGFGWLCIMWKF